MPSLEIRDKNGRLLRVSDLVIVHYAFIDGYLPKKYPERLRKVAKVYWDRMRGCYDLEIVGTHEDDAYVLEWLEEKGKTYRRLDYDFEVSLKRNESGMREGGQYRDDMVCEDVERLPKGVTFVPDMWHDEDGNRLEAPVLSKRKGRK